MAQTKSPEASGQLPGVARAASVPFATFTGALGAQLPRLQNLQSAVWRKWVSRPAHNLKIVGSNPTAAERNETSFSCTFQERKRARQRTWVTAPAEAPAAAGLMPRTGPPPALPTMLSAKKAPPLHPLGRPQLVPVGPQLALGLGHSQTKSQAPSSGAPYASMATSQNICRFRNQSCSVSYMLHMTPNNSVLISFPLTELLT